MVRYNSEANQVVVATGQNLTDLPFADEAGVSHEDEVKDIVLSRRLRDNLSQMYLPASRAVFCPPR